MKHIIIIGGNSGARLAYELCELNNFNIIGFSSNYTEKWYTIEPVILPDYKNTYTLNLIKKYDYFVATGDNNIREEITNFIIKNTQKKPINLIHPTSIISKYTNIGYGNLILANTIINNGTNIGNGVIINSSSVIEHDNIIYDYSQISPSSTLCGYVTIGKKTFIGSNSVVIPNITIKDNSIVGAGSVVINNVESSILVVGNPAKFKKKII